MRKRKNQAFLWLLLGGSSLPVLVLLILSLPGRLLSTQPNSFGQAILAPTSQFDTETLPAAIEATSTREVIEMENSPTSLPENATITPDINEQYFPALLGKIVFTCTPELYNQLCLMNADGSDYVRITDHKANDYYPSLSNNGEMVYFVSNRTGQFEVYSLNLISNATIQLTNQIGNPSAPGLSPDGSLVVFALKNDDGQSIWLTGVDGKDPYPITDEQWNEIDPSWSPDGRQIAIAAVRGGYVELFTLKPDGSEIRQVTKGVYGIGGRNSWSPDGSKLVFYAGPKGDRDIYIVEITSGEITQLTHGGNNTGPCFSPDGQWIAFSSSRNGDHDVFVMRLDGSQVTQLTDNDYDDWQPRWGN